MRNSAFIFLLKMEYVYKVNNFGLQMTVKSGLEKNIFKFIHGDFFFFHFIKMSKIANSVIKMALFALALISIFFWDVHMYT